MRKVLTRYQVDPTFLSVLFSFGEMPHLAESGSSNIASIESGNGSRSKTSFLNQSQQILMSPERFLIRSDTLKRTTDHRTGPGLLDRRVSTITIPPIEDSLFEQQLASLAKTQASKAELASLVEDPYRLHIMPLALYLDNWRWYFRYLGEEFQDKVRCTWNPRSTIADSVLE